MVHIPFNETLRQIPGLSVPAASDTANLPHSEKPSHPNTSQHLHLPQPCLSSDTPKTSSLQSDTSTSNVQPNNIPWSLTNQTMVDQNYNLRTSESSQNSSITYSETLESSTPSYIPNTSLSPSQPSSPGPDDSRNSETFCQNCKNELSDDLNVTIPPPVYFYDFLAECPSPWLHYGYCTPCLVVARFTNNTSIIQHIARCPALLDQCWDGEHEDLISEYKEKEAMFADSGLHST